MERYIANDIQSILRSIDCSLKSLTLMKIEEMKKQGYTIPMDWLPGGNWEHDEVVKIIGYEYLNQNKKRFL